MQCFRHPDRPGMVPDRHEPAWLERAVSTPHVKFGGSLRKQRQMLLDWVALRERHNTAAPGPSHV